MFQTSDVQFSLPGYQKKDQRLPAISSLISRTRELSGFPLQILKEAERYLHEFNRSKMAEVRRLELLDSVTTCVLPSVKQIFSEHHKAHPVPESDVRKEGLSLAQSCCNEIALGYLRIVQHDFDVSRLGFHKVRERLRFSGHRILEFYYVELRLRALRYKALPVESWGNINQLFFGLYRLDEVGYRLEALTCLTLHSRNFIGKDDVAAVSLVELFAMLHTLGAVDVFTLPTQSIHVVANYLHRSRSSFNVLELESETQNKGFLQVYQGQNSCATSYLAPRAGLGLQIDISGFRAALRQDCERLVQLFEQPYQAQANEMSFYMVSGQEDVECLVAVIGALNNIAKDDRCEERVYLGHFDPVVIYSGYKPCFNRLAQQTSANDGPIVDNTFREMLAQRSATVAENETSNEQSQWLVVNSSSGGLLVETRESRFTRSIFVGQLLMYSENLAAPQELSLGYVGRLHRDNNTDKLQMAIVNVSRAFSAVAVQSVFLQHNALALPGILCLDYLDYPALILHTTHRLHPETPISLLRQKRRVRHRVEDIVLIKREFALYQLSEILKPA